MSGTQPRFQLIEDEPPAPAPAAQPAPSRDQAARQVLFAALRALSQRAQTAITNLFSLMLVGSVWALAARILDDPTENRLIGVFGYAVFCLCTDIVRRRK